MNFNKIILILIIFASCSENIQQSEQQNIQQQATEEAEPKDVSVTKGKNNKKEEKRYVAKDTLIEGFTPEMSVNSIELQNYKSTERLNKNLTTVEAVNGESFPHVDFSNSSNTERLRLIAHYGGTRNAFSEMEVTYNSIENNVNILEIHNFQSGRGIKLGMSRKEVENILGEANINFENKLRYRIVDVNTDTSEFLEKYNYPSYYIDAEFNDNKLVKYRFGFDYP